MRQQGAKAGRIATPQMLEQSTVRVEESASLTGTASRIPPRRGRAHKPRGRPQPWRRSSTALIVVITARGASRGSLDRPDGRVVSSVIRDRRELACRQRGGNGDVHVSLRSAGRPHLGRQLPYSAAFTVSIGLCRLCRDVTNIRAREVSAVLVPVTAPDGIVPPAPGEDRDAPSQRQLARNPPEERRRAESVSPGDHHRPVTHVRAAHPAAYRWHPDRDDTLQPRAGTPGEGDHD